MENHNKISENSRQFKENSKLHYTGFRKKKLETVVVEFFQGATKWIWTS